MLLVGAYIAFVRAGSESVKGSALRLLGFGLLGLGAAGTLLGALRLVAVAPFDLPIWLTIVTILDVALIAYALYYALVIYPARRGEEQSRAQAARRAAARGRPSIEANGAGGLNSGYDSPHSTTSARREARRGRKRKSR
jgi:hypothetical protein